MCKCSTSAFDSTTANCLLHKKIHNNKKCLQTLSCFFGGWSRRKMILGFFPLSLHSCFCSLSSRSGVNSSWPENIAARNCRILLVSNTFSRKWHFLSLCSVPALSLKALTSNKLGILSIFVDQRGLLVEKSIMLDLF